MADERTVSTGWCKVHYSNCYWEYNEHTGNNKHIGTRADFLDYFGKMKRTGFQCSQRSDVWHFYRRASAPLNIPVQLDWLMAMEARESIENDPPEQDW
jgi:hypothetical protein